MEKENFEQLSLEEDCDELILCKGEELTTDERNNYNLKMHVANVFFGYVIGKRGQTLSNIESETKASVNIPRYNRGEENFIHIIARSRPSLRAAHRRISSVVSTFRKKQKLTHFVCIPLAHHSQLRDRFLEFKKQILEDTECSLAKGIEESLFQSKDRLHITLCVLFCGDSLERDQASQLLKKFQSKFLNDFLSSNLSSGQKVRLHVNGLDIMNDDPTEANVLYAKVAEVGTDGLFQRITNKIYDWFEISYISIFVKFFVIFRFQDSGLVCQADRFDEMSGWKVKIHATLMNTRYALTEEQIGNGRKSKTMDVSNILKKFQHFDFGIMDFDQIHLSTLNSYDSQTQFYHKLSSIQF